MIEQYLNNINLLPKVSGVYSIVNVLNGNRYIDCILGKRQEAFGFKWRYSNDK